MERQQLQLQRAAFYVQGTTPFAAPATTYPLHHSIPSSSSWQWSQPLPNLHDDVNQRLSLLRGLLPQTPADPAPWQWLLPGTTTVSEQTSSTTTLPAVASKTYGTNRDAAELSSPLPKSDTSEVVGDGVETSSNVVGPWSDRAAALLGDMALPPDIGTEKTSGRGRGKKRRVLPKSKDLPKRPLSAYNIFFQAERKKILSAIPEPHETQCNNNTKKRKIPPHGKIGFESLA